MISPDHGTLDPARDQNRFWSGLIPQDIYGYLPLLLSWPLPKAPADRDYVHIINSIKYLSMRRDYEHYLEDNREIMK